jgi:hypothetical protein
MEPSGIENCSYQEDGVYPPTRDNRKVFQTPRLINAAVSQGRGLEGLDERERGAKVAADGESAGTDSCQKETRGVNRESNPQDFAWASRVVTSKYSNNKNR